MMPLIAATSGSSGGGSGVVFLVIVIAVVALLIMRARNRARRRAIWAERVQRRVELSGARDHFAVGTIVGGMGGSSGIPALCAAGKNDLVFISDFVDGNVGDHEEPAPELGRIPRDGVALLAVRDATNTQKHVQVVQRLSVTRMAVLGPLSLAAPKRKKVESTTTIPKFYLDIEWADGNRVGQKTVFEFSSGQAANAAENAIRQALRARTAASSPAPTAPDLNFPPASATHVQPDVGEKKCPMCAELIKAEAIKCRYCGSELARA